MAYNLINNQTTVLLYSTQLYYIIVHCKLVSKMSFDLPCTMVEIILWWHVIEPAICARPGPIFLEGNTVEGMNAYSYNKDGFYKRYHNTYVECHALLSVLRLDGYTTMRDWTVFTFCKVTKLVKSLLQEQRRYIGWNMDKSTKATCMWIISLSNTSGRCPTLP